MNVSFMNSSGYSNLFELEKVIQSMLQSVKHLDSLRITNRAIFYQLVEPFKNYKLIPAGFSNT